MENIIGARLRILRENMDLRQKELAAKIGATKDKIHNWESGRGKPSIDELSVLARFFEIPTDYLLGLSDKKTNYSKEVMAVSEAPGSYDSCTDNITDNLKLMTPEEREAIRRLTQSIANRQSKDVG